MSKRPSSVCASGGRPTRSHFGTTVAPSIRPCGTTFPTNATAIELRSAATSRFDKQTCWQIGETGYGVSSKICLADDGSNLGESRAYRRWRPTGRYQEKMPFSSLGYNATSLQSARNSQSEGERVDVVIETPTEAHLEATQECSSAGGVGLLLRMG